MAIYGMDIPTARTPEDRAKRRAIFQIIAPYVLSEKDIKVIEETPVQLQDLWFESFAASQRGMLYTNLQIKVKKLFGKYFPPNGTLPAPDDAAAIGLQQQSTMLSR